MHACALSLTDGLTVRNGSTHTVDQERPSCVQQTNLQLSNTGLYTSWQHIEDRHVEAICGDGYTSAWACW